MNSKGRSGLRKGTVDTGVGKQVVNLNFIDRGGQRKTMFKNKLGRRAQAATSVGASPSPVQLRASGTGQTREPQSCPGDMLVPDPVWGSPEKLLGTAGWLL